jgi:hypothetical protein
VREGSFAPGTTIRISAEPADARVVGTRPGRIVVDWPWNRSDPDSPHPWPGTAEFPVDPTAYGWRNTPWRVEPEPETLEVGSSCMIGIPPFVARVRSVTGYDPVFEYGILPRPDLVVGAVDVAYEGDDEAGFTIYLGTDEPIEVEAVPERADE